MDDKVAAVNRMQEYIAAHLDGEITLEALGAAAGYSKYYAVRAFGELTGRTPFAYIRALRLTRAAQALRDGGGGLVRSTSPVIDAALDSGFDSHDGFTRAFMREFGVNPQEYARKTPAVRYFVPYPIAAYYTLKEGAEPMPKEKVPRTVTVTTVERPARKLIFLRTGGRGYFKDCEEVGCDWEGFYNSIPEKFDTAAGCHLPRFLVKPGTSGSAFCVEVPLDYNKPIPEGYESAELPPCTYLYFTGMPYDDPNDFCVAIGIVNEAVGAYPFERFGWKRSENGPDLGMGADAETGARFAMPVERV